MLVVSRRKEQSVVVGEFDGFERLLRVTVLEVHGAKVRLGFEVVSEDAASRYEDWERHSRDIRVRGRNRLAAPVVSPPLSPIPDSVLDDASRSEGVRRG